MVSFWNVFKFKQRILNGELLDAARNGEYKRTKILLNQGADVNFKKKGETALLEATFYQYAEVVKVLIEAGADVNIQDNYGKTALIWASEREYTDIVDILIRSDADVNVQDNNQDTALIFASKNDHPQVAQLLIEAGADVNIQGNYGKTALIYAVRGSCRAVFEALIKAGADAGIKDDYGRIALDFDKEKNYQETLRDLNNCSKSPEWVSPSEKNTMAVQVQLLSAEEIKELPKADPELLQKLCLVVGLMEVTFCKLNYAQQKALYAHAHNAVSPQIRKKMEESLKNNTEK